MPTIGEQELILSLLRILHIDLRDTHHKRTSVIQGWVLMYILCYNLVANIKSSIIIC